MLRNTLIAHRSAGTGTGGGLLRATAPALFLQATPPRLLHPKKTKRRPVRTQHTVRWWKQAKPSHLTAKPIEEAPDRPGFPAFQMEVDQPHVVPKEGVACFNCKEKVDTEMEHVTEYVWIPSGAADVPTKAGYFFHTKCFGCAKCGFRFHHNKFYSIDGKAVCIGCALGKPPKFPYRWWHSSTQTVSNSRLGSRMTGRSWPRHQHQYEYLFDPNS